MKYGINIFNNLKGCHNLLVFNTMEEAEENYRLLDNLWSNEEFCKDFDEIDFEILYNSVFANSVDYIEYISIEDKLDENNILENFKFVSDDVKVLFDNEYVTIPC